MDKPTKLATLGTQDKDKQNKKLLMLKYKVIDDVTIDRIIIL